MFVLWGVPEICPVSKKMSQGQNVKAAVSSGSEKFTRMFHEVTFRQFIGYTYGVVISCRIFLPIKKQVSF
jgi:hypothetical protein